MIRVSTHFLHRVLHLAKHHVDSRLFESSDDSCDEEGWCNIYTSWLIIRLVLVIYGNKNIDGND